MPIQIPFARTIEEIIAGLPTNSRQALQLRDLAAKMEVLEKENADLKAQLARLQPDDALPIEAVQLLKHVFKAETAPMVYELERLSGMEKGVVVHHLRSLAKAGYVKGHRDFVGMERLSVTHEGSTFLLKHLG